MATISAKTRLPVTGEADGWLRVKLKDRPAYLRTRDLEVSSNRTRSTGQYDVHLSISPPAIEVVGRISQTDQDSISNSGTARGDDGVRDLYITVVNPSRNLFARREKVFFQAAKDSAMPSMDFAADIPLTPGNNLIEIHARRDEDVVGTERMWVLCTKGLEEARAKERERVAQAR